MPAFLKNGSEHYNRMRRIHPRDAISKLDYYLPTTPTISSSSASSSAKTSGEAYSSSSAESSRFASSKTGQLPHRTDASDTFVRKRRVASNKGSFGGGSSGTCGESPCQTSGFSDGTLIAEQTISEEFKPPDGIVGLQDNRCYVVDQNHGLALGGRKKSRIAFNTTSNIDLVEELVRRSAQSRSGLAARFSTAAARQQLFNQQVASTTPSSGTARLKRRHVKRLNRRMLAGGDGDLQLGDEYALSELFSQSEIPGFREIFASDSYLRKFCWIVAFLFMTVLSLNDMTELITEYFEYPITVDVRLKDSARLPFPAVTVCNLNVVRFSALCSSSSHSDLANQIPSALRDKLCGLQVDKKNNNSTGQGADSDMADINNIGITTTTTTTTTTTSTTSTTSTAAPTTTTETSGSAGLPSVGSSTQSSGGTSKHSNGTNDSNDVDGDGDDGQAEAKPSSGGGKTPSGRPASKGPAPENERKDAASQAAPSTATTLASATTSRPGGGIGGGLDLGSDYKRRRPGERRRVSVAGASDLSARVGPKRIGRSIKLADLQQDQGQQSRPFASSKSRVRISGQQDPPDSQSRPPRRPSFQRQPPGIAQANVMRDNPTHQAVNRPAAPSAGILSQHVGMGRPPGGPNLAISVTQNSHQNPLLGSYVSTLPPSSAGGASATTPAQSTGLGGHQIGQPNVGLNSPALPEDFELTERQERELQENLTNWLAVMYNRDPPLTRSLGHQFDDMILRCTMKSINCTHQRSFENSFTPTEGNCFTYRSKIKRRLPAAGSSPINSQMSSAPRGGTSSSASSSSSFEEANLAGTNHGLELVLNLEKNEYISGSSQVGALVMIHHPSDLGYAASEATFVAPEFTTYIGLKMVNLTRLPAPYPEYCVDSWPGKFADTLTRNSTYSQQACLKICLQKTIQSHCQCQSAFLPIVELESNQFHSANHDPSSSSSSSKTMSSNSSNQVKPPDQPSQRIIICDTRKVATRQCVRNVMFRAADRVHNCECPPKCQVVRYDKTISMARWPTREDKVSFDRGKMDVNFQNLAKVIVYFQTMTCDEITQQAVFNAAKLFSALGGIMGMYVGFSFLSVFEIFEVMSRKMWHHLMVRLARASTRFTGGRFRA